MSNTNPVLFEVPAWEQSPRYKVGERAEYKPAPDGKVWWSGDAPPPAIGSMVYVRMNGLKWAKVEGYKRVAGYLGLQVTLEQPPEWYIKQNGGNVPGCVFGAEIDFEKEAA